MSSASVTHGQAVFFSVIIAMMLAIAPLPDWAVPYRPDFVALTLIYWAMNLSRHYSVGWAWVIGLVLDVAQGPMLGQHALALSLVIYVTIKFHLQFLQFPVMQLTATVFALLSLYQFVLFWINGVAGISAPAASYWGPVITGTLLWPLATMLFTRARLRVRR